MLVDGRGAFRDLDANDRAPAFVLEVVARERERVKVPEIHVIHRAVASESVVPLAANEAYLRHAEGHRRAHDRAYVVLLPDVMNDQVGSRTIR